MRHSHYIIGLGEVGLALKKVLGCEGFDIAQSLDFSKIPEVDFLHICFPYTDDFAACVRSYQGRCRPLFTIIHSTVPISTCDYLNAHSSPVRGRHPKLAESLKTFVKYVGGPHAETIVSELQKFGIPAVSHHDSRSIEAGKLIDLMQFGASILLEKEIHQFCQDQGLDFNTVYRDFNRTYNSGYSKLHEYQFIRPMLEHIPGPIGGHCIVENMQHLDIETARRIAEFSAVTNGNP